MSLLPRKVTQSGNVFICQNRFSTIRFSSKVITKGVVFLILENFQCITEPNLQEINHKSILSK